MNIEINEHSGLKLLSLTGDIDMHTSPLVRNELLALVRIKVPVLLVDFSGVSYIDSSGIATFVEGLKGMMAYGGRLKLLGIRDNIIEIFNFSKLDKVFEIYRSIEDALRS